MNRVSTIFQHWMHKSIFEDKFAIIKSFQLTLQTHSNQMKTLRMRCVKMNEVEYFINDLN